MELLKLLNVYEIIVQILSFLLLFLLLRRFFWRQFIKLLDTRREKIAADFKSIDAQKAEIEKIRLEYAEKLKKIEDEAKKKIQAAINEGEKITEELKKKAQQEAQKIIDNAKNDIQFELTKAKDGLKEEIIDLVLNATQHLLGEKITEEKDKRMVKDFLEGIDKIK